MSIYTFNINSNLLMSIETKTHAILAVITPFDIQLYNTVLVNY